jgi:hypothetical protein
LHDINSQADDCCLRAPHFSFSKPAQKLVAILAVIFNVTHQNTLPATDLDEYFDQEAVARAAKKRYTSQ